MVARIEVSLQSYYLSHTIFQKKIKPDQGLRIVLIFVLLLFSVQFNTYTHISQISLVTQPRFKNGCSEDHDELTAIV